MPSVGDLLRRFRFHGVPGGPAQAGVPVDRTREFEAELEPVFSFLEAAQRRAEVIVEEARTECASRRRQGSEQANRILDRAKAEAEIRRVDSMNSELTRADERSRALLEQAREEAERIDRVAEERVPPLAEELVRRVLQMGVDR